jgi:hypothetical protein
MLKHDELVVQPDVNAAFSDLFLRIQKRPDGEALFRRPI